MNQTQWIVPKRWLHVPVKTGAARIKLILTAPDGWMTHFEVELGTATDHDFLAPLNLERYVGGPLRVEVTGDETAARRLPEVVRWTDQPEGFSRAYSEPLRPLFHFTSRRGWLNDPNGCAFFEGRYHLFYQHNPFGWNWGNMSWGHAVSEDLFHWREDDQDALLPDDLGTMYSGSAVVDWKNTSGLGEGSRPPLVLLYTAAGEHAPNKPPYTQCLAYSTDGGKTFRKYAGNPVVRHIAGGNRDPKVFWHAPSQSWVMALYLTEGGAQQNCGLLSHTPQRFALLRSPNLREWQQASELVIPCNGECPDLFPLPLDGDPNKERWIFWTADGQYLIGAFDGWRFTPEQGPFEIYMGGRERASGYAAQTFSDVPDGRRIQIPWLQASDFPGMPFNQQMGTPVELTLHSTANGPRLHARPARELDKLCRSLRTHVNAPLNNALFEGLTGDGFRIRARLDLRQARAVHWTFQGRELSFDIAAREIRFGPWKAPNTTGPGVEELDILVDRGSIEVFGRQGIVYLPLYALKRASGIEARVDGAVTVERMDLFEVPSVWPNAGLA